MTAPHEEFIHRFIPASQDTARAATLLVLHGTGGNENEWLPFPQMLADKHSEQDTPNMLSPRGRVIENGMPRFFRRLAEGVFDIEDVKFRAHQLADFIEQAATTYGFDVNKVIAVGYSNGANIAAALLLLRPSTVAGAVLFRPMVPFVPEALPDLSAVPVFIAAGRVDPIVHPAETERLAELLRSAGANVTVHWEAGGHALGREEVERAGEWLSQELVKV